MKAGDELTEEISHQIEDSGIEEMEIRSVLTCEPNTEYVLNATDVT